MTKKCSICGCFFEGFGNNAWPVNDGVCCNKCNNEVVIPRRITDLYSKNKNKTKEDKE